MNRREIPLIPRQEALPLRRANQGSVVFSIQFASNHSELFLVDPDGKNLRQLTQLGGLNDSPRWLPNGDIVFVATCFGAFNICIMDAEGKSVRNVTFHDEPAEGACNMVTVSHDQQLVYQSNLYAFDPAKGYGDWEVCIRNQDGSNLRRLSTDYFTPACSPVVAEIACTSIAYTTRNMLSILDFEGTVIDQVVMPEAESCFRPQWMADGRQIACPVIWHSDYRTDPARPNFFQDIVMVDRLTKACAPLHPAWRVAGRDITWLPEENAVIFASHEYTWPISSLYRLDLSENHVVPIAELPYHCTAPHYPIL